MYFSVTVTQMWPELEQTVEKTITMAKLSFEDLKKKKGNKGYIQNHKGRDETEVEAWWSGVTSTDCINNPFLLHELLLFTRDFEKPQRIITKITQEKTSLIFSFFCRVCIIIANKPTELNVGKMPTQTGEKSHNSQEWVRPPNHSLRRHQLDLNKFCRTLRCGWNTKHTDYRHFFNGVNKTS